MEEGPDKETAMATLEEWRFEFQSFQVQADEYRRKNEAYAAEAADREEEAKQLEADRRATIAENYQSYRQ